MDLIRSFDIFPSPLEDSPLFSADFIMCPEQNNKTWIIIFSHRFLSCCYCSLAHQSILASIGDLCGARDNMRSCDKRKAQEKASWKRVEKAIRRTYCYDLFRELRMRGWGGQEWLVEFVTINLVSWQLVLSFKRPLSSWALICPRSSEQAWLWKSDCRIILDFLGTTSTLGGVSFARILLIAS